MRKTLIVAGLLLAIAFLSGCEKFTRANYEAIELGVMNKSDVKQILGKPYIEGDDFLFYNDRNRLIEAKIWFDETGVVKEKRWFNYQNLDEMNLETEPW